ncbi:aconitase family protein [uncultured Roseobacter sp.]|uniref:cis-3-hydroxy-L-proline dehydratase n=1 Tax=uncultured Roseobacter sp. TaxID=114847 RepID=UPI002638490B|nr:aconitase family protein [uncultured Roseobacter sp.]
MAQLIVPAPASGSILVCTEGLSFWGGVDASSGAVIDAHHPQSGQSLAGRIVMMPTSRGSCSGSGVLVELAMNGRAPAALIFREPEDVLTLGAIIATRMFDRPIAVVRLAARDYDTLATKSQAEITGTRLLADGLSLRLDALPISDLALSESDRSMLDGTMGSAAKLAMETLCTVASSQNAKQLTDVTRAHIDGCIYASPANLIFAEKIASLDAKVCIPTTMNAISVDRQNWRDQDVPPNLGLPASRLADVYVDMGALPTFTCAPYQSTDHPLMGEQIGWSESNAVIYANSVLGARSAKHPDFLDLFIALTGRAPLSGVYLAENRQAEVIIDVALPTDFDDAIWPLIGWLVGQKAPDRIPLLKGLEGTSPSEDDLRAVCAAFGTTSAAPLLHLAGITPEGDHPAKAGATQVQLTQADFKAAWKAFNTGPSKIDLVALGSPHFSLSETRTFASLMTGRKCHPSTSTIITLSRATKAAAAAEGLLSELTANGVQVLCDLCWCSISEPVFPTDAQTLMTNSGKYAHYAPGLSGRQVRFGGLAACAAAATSGIVDDELPHWLR